MKTRVRHFAIPALLVLGAHGAVGQPTVLHAFSNQLVDEKYPIGKLLQASDGFLYGTTAQGGAGGYGTIFREDPTTNTMTVLYSFTGVNGTGTGAYPQAGLIQATNGKLYGTTLSGGVNQSDGTAFSVDLSTSPVTVTKIHDFNNTPTDGSGPYFGGLVQGSDGLLYGTTYQGGQSNQGTVFRMGLDGSGFTLLHSFHSGTQADGYRPDTSLAEADDGRLFGTVRFGGANGYGAVFYLNKDGSGFGLAHSFNSGPADGREALGQLTKGIDGKLYGTAHYGGTYDLGIVYVIDPSTPDSGFSIVYSFDGETGAWPLAGLSVAGSGTLYGATSAGGQNGYGTVFSLDTSAAFSVLAGFNGSDAWSPYSPPILGADGNLYGTSEYGGIRVQLTNGNGYGSLYSIDPNGNSTLLHSLGEYEDGFSAQSTPVLGQDGNLYGATYSGGIFKQGVFFQANPQGGYQILHIFHDDGSGFGEGAHPTSVMQGPDGSFYGTCESNDTPLRYGTIWKIDPSGSIFTVLYRFNGLNGLVPEGRLLVGLDGRLYGTTTLGGAPGGGTIFRVGTDGSGFTLLHEFHPGSGNDGYSPYAGLAQDAAGVLYGATSAGGASNLGTVFKLNPNGTGFTVLHSLTQAEGANPQGTPVLGVESGRTYLYVLCKAGGSLNGGGTLIRVDTQTGAASIIHSFHVANPDADGAVPLGDLLLGADGALYGTCSGGGSQPLTNRGTAWRCDTAGNFTTLTTFTQGFGWVPLAGLAQDGSGTLYGVVSQAGTNGGGTLFSIP